MASSAVKQIQQALKNKGFDPGEIDGIWGRNTIAAVMQFQQRQGLEVDGIVGPETSAALFSGTPSAIPANTPLLPWFEEARHLMGTKEVLGNKNNPDIMDWAKNLDISYAGDDVTMCRGADYSWRIVSVPLCSRKYCREIHWVRGSGKNSASLPILVWALSWCSGVNRWQAEKVMWVSMPVKMTMPIKFLVEINPMPCV